MNTNTEGAAMLEQMDPKEALLTWDRFNDRAIAITNREIMIYNNYIEKHIHRGDIKTVLLELGIDPDLNWKECSLDRLKRLMPGA